MSYNTEDYVVNSYIRENCKVNMPIALIHMTIQYLLDPFGSFTFIKDPELKFLQIKDQSITMDTKYPYTWFNNVPYGDAFDISPFTKIIWCQEMKFEESKQEYSWGPKKKAVIGVGVIFNKRSFKNTGLLSDNTQMMIYYEMNSNCNRLCRACLSYKKQRIGPCNMKTGDIFAIIIEKEASSKKVNIKLKINNDIVDSVNDLTEDFFRKIDSIQLIASVATNKTSIKLISIDYKTKALKY